MVPSLRRSWPLGAARAGRHRALAWLGLQGFAFSDYDREAAPAYLALAHGDVGGFLSLCPAYGGSLIMRAPFAMLPDLLGRGRARGLPRRRRAVPAGRRRAGRRARRAACSPAALGPRHRRHRRPASAPANPITLRALDDRPSRGAARRRAVRRRGARRGARALDARRASCSASPSPTRRGRCSRSGRSCSPCQADRRRALAIAGAIAVAFMLPLLLPAPASGHAGREPRAGAIFQPWQVWWFLGATGDVIRGADGLIKEGYRSAPGWVSPISHPLIVAVALPLSLLAWRRRSDPLLLLALLFVLRCVLDPWNTSYYVLPAILALVGVGGDALRSARRSSRSRHDARRGRLANGSSPSTSADVEALRSTSAGACRSSPCWAGGSTRRRCPRSRRSARAAA